MPPLSPLSKAQAIIKTLEQREKTMAMLEDFEYRRLSRETDASLKDDPVAGWFAKTLLAAFIGDLNQFKLNANNLQRLDQSNERLPPLLFGLSVALGDMAYARCLVEQMNLQSPVALHEKFIALAHLYKLEQMQELSDLAERANLMQTLPSYNTIEMEDMAEILVEKNISEAEFNAMHDVAAQAALKNGVVLLSTPIRYFDEEEDCIFLTYSLPIDYEKAFQIEKAYIELSRNEANFPHGKVLFAVDVRGVQ